jgi:hypothetical protein
MSIKLKFWIAGVALAISGLILARVVSSLYASQAIMQLSIFLAGVVVALAGLGIILMGIRKG